MKHWMRDFVEAILMVALAVVGAAAQQATPPQIAAEKHVKDIKAEQTNQTIFASPLCDLVKANGGHYLRRHEVSLATLAPNLFDLMSQSDEVVVSSAPLGLGKRDFTFGRRRGYVLRCQGASQLQGAFKSRRCSDLWRAPWVR